jgi:hypothetical protein
MEKKTGGRAADPTEHERRKNLSDGDVKDLELAGGVEGGMRAGSAGGPSGGDRKKAPQRDSQRRDD